MGCDLEVISRRRWKRDDGEKQKRWAGAVERRLRRWAQPKEQYPDRASVARNPRAKSARLARYFFDSTAMSTKTAARCKARLIDSEDSVAPLIASMS